ncbi:MAG: hypothetical protein AAF909_03620 [Pseudomonadota bacterium]
MDPDLRSWLQTEVQPTFQRPALDDWDPIAESLEATGVATVIDLDRRLAAEGFTIEERRSELRRAAPLLRQRLEEELEFQLHMEAAGREDTHDVQRRRGHTGSIRSAMAGASPGQITQLSIIRSQTSRELSAIRRLDPAWRQPPVAMPTATTPRQVLSNAQIYLRALQYTRWEMQFQAANPNAAGYTARQQAAAAAISSGVRNPYWMGSYTALRGMRDRTEFRFPMEIQHLNMQSMMGGAVPHGRGASVTILGNPTRGAPSEHMTWHRRMEKSFFAPYRSRGVAPDQFPTFAEYNAAAARAYREAGFSASAIRRLMDLQIREQRAFGFAPHSPLPRLPKPVQVPARHFWSKR